jgi:flagellar hook protein FlgE
MSFQTGLSGLSAASRNLDVIGNNIANANTIGAKVARAEFSEIVAASTIAANGRTEGIGVEVATVAQQFTQGTVNVTGNPLDIAINGAGFFELTMPNGTTTYSRAGMFKLDDQGNIINNAGGQLLGYPTDPDGNRISFNPVPLSLPTASPIPAQQTAGITAEFNLDARAPVWNAVTPNTPLSTYGTSLVAFDSQGLEIPVALAFRKVGNNSWEVYHGVNGADPALSTPFTVNFLADGSLDTATTTIPQLTLSSANGNFNVDLDFDNITQYGTAFSVTELDQDGYRPGQFIGLKINENGIVTGQYSNGETRAAGQIALVNFRNTQGLQPMSGGMWSATFSSGDPLRGEPASGNFGALRAGALEDSNVDITAELVNMMTAQRAYQANAQTIKTQDQVLSTLLNMR